MQLKSLLFAFCVDFDFAMKVVWTWSLRSVAWSITRIELKFTYGNLIACIAMMMTTDEVFLAVESFPVYYEVKL